MSEYILVHHGIKGMKWGVRRSKAQLARLTNRSESDISDEEAKEFRQDVKKANRARTYKKRRNLRSSTTAKRGEEYTKAVFKQARFNSNVKTIATAASVVVGKRVVKSYLKKQAGIVELDNGTTLYTNPRGSGISSK